MTCRNNNRKAICFITGVPGAGKTLIGLNTAIDQFNRDEKAVYLSGNFPLVEVLQEALARDYVRRDKIKAKQEKRKAVKAEGKFVRQSGGKGQYGHCWLEITPREPGEGFLFENKVVGGAIPKEYIAPIEAGVKEAMENGVVAGYPMVDIAVAVYDGSYHEVDSSEMAFKIAGSMGFRSGAEKANPVILEPYMKVEITVPEEYMGDVIGDVNSRRGRIEGMEARNGAQVIHAFVPLAEMFHY